MMKIDIPNPVSVTFIVAPLEKIIGPFLLPSIPREGEKVRISTPDRLYGGEVLNVIWHLDIDNDQQRVEVFFRDTVPDTLAKGKK